MKKNRIFIFGDGNIALYIIISVLLVCFGIGLLWFPDEGGWIITLVVDIPVIIVNIFCICGRQFAYVIKENEEIVIYNFLGKKLRSYLLKDLYEISARKIAGNRWAGKYICLYFSERSRLQSANLNFISEIWNVKEIMFVIYHKEHLKWLQETLGEEVWKEKYKGT